jgi:nitrogen fixation NifU-like protein
MTTVVRGEPLEAIQAIGSRFRALVTGETLPASGESDDRLRRLMPLAGVAQFPIRVKCATLAWHALDAALAEASVNGDGRAR